VGLSLTVLGSCGSYPGAGGACSGYLVQGEGTTLWIDAGSGTMANLQRHVSLEDVDGVVLSHEHPDHWSDIEGFRVACAYVINRDGVPAFGPAGLTRLLYKDFKMVLDWHEVGDGDNVRVGALDVTFARTDHGPETLAMRIDGGGRSLGYSADTGPGWALAGLGAGIDLALCEATYTTKFEGVSKHLSGRQAGLAAKAAGVKRLLLTHFWPTLRATDIRDEAVSTFGGPVEIAVENERYEV
jgi:ribonuclease BN (tRNA processing enzyme)